LNGEPKGLNKLAAGLVKWFCEKAQMRLNDAPTDVTRAVLIAVAARFDDPSRVGHKRDDWVNPAVEVAGCTQVAAGRWFGEAVSSGLVETVSLSEWRWRHDFVCEYLRSADHESPVA
jgi:hypothetical protein